MAWVREGFAFKLRKDREMWAFIGRESIAFVDRQTLCEQVGLDWEVEEAVGKSSYF